MLQEGQKIKGFAAYSALRAEVRQSQVDEAYYSTLSFAVFRANLNLLGMGGDIEADKALYRHYIHAVRCVNLQECTFFEPQDFQLTFKREADQTVWESLLASHGVFFVCSFHYALFRTLLFWLLLNDIEVYMLSTSDSASQYAFTRYFEQFGWQPKVKFININQPLSLLTLGKLMFKKRKNPIAIYALIDGNRGEGKQALSIPFCGRTLRLVCKITSLASLLKIPLVDMSMTEGEESLCAEVNGIYKVAPTRHRAEAVTLELYKTFEQKMSRETIFEWYYICKVHHWVSNRPQPNGEVRWRDREREAAALSRFTLIVQDGQAFLFDSKYYLSYVYTPTPHDTLSAIVNAVNPYY